MENRENTVTTQKNSSGNAAASLGGLPKNIDTQSVIAKDRPPAAQQHYPTGKANLKYTLNIMGTLAAVPLHHLKAYPRVLHHKVQKPRADPQLHNHTTTKEPKELDIHNTMRENPSGSAAAETKDHVGVPT